MSVAWLRLLRLPALLLLTLASSTPLAAESADLWLVLSSAGEPGERLISELTRDLSRTPRLWEVSSPGPDEWLAMAEEQRPRVLLEVTLDAEAEEPIVELARAEDRSTPGWLVHAVLRASAAIGEPVHVVDGRSSWFGQLVARSTRGIEAGPADEALRQSIPALRLRLPEEIDAGSVGLLAATVRRLEGLEGAPRFEDEFLVAAGRVWLRRDVYWLGLVLWVVLYFRGRGRPGREFRWAFLVCWLVTPIFSFALLSLPALFAAWRPPGRLWAGLASLLPVAFYSGQLALALGQGARPTVSAIPTLAILLSLGLFTWDLFTPASDEAG